MKIRKCYVSNSSSSSFVLEDGKSLESAEDALMASVLEIAADDMWNDDEFVSEDGLKLALSRAVASSDSRERIKVNVMNAISSVSNAYYWYVRSLIEMRINGISADPACYEDGSRRGFVVDFMLRERKVFRDRLSFYPLGRYPRRILRLIRSGLEKGARKCGPSVGDGIFPVEFDDEILTATLDESDGAIDTEAEAWIDSHPNARILEFSSESGDRNETAMRFEIWRIAGVLWKSGAEGFVGDDS